MSLSLFLFWRTVRKSKQYMKQIEKKSLFAVHCLRTAINQSIMQLLTVRLCMGGLSVRPVETLLISR